MVWLSRILAVCPPAMQIVLIKWFIGPVVAGVGVNLFRSSVARTWAWLPEAAFAAVLSVAVPSPQQGRDSVQQERDPH